jgi:hypothetical protein
MAFIYYSVRNFKTASASAHIRCGSQVSVLEEAHGLCALAANRIGGFHLMQHAYDYAALIVPTWAYGETAVALRMC